MTPSHSPIDRIVVSNPKLYKDSPTAQETRIFPYYAGFSDSFVGNLLDSLALSPEATVLDPWNGSGTTTIAAFGMGYKAIGYDLNPAMVVVARARMLSPLEYPSLPAIAKTLVEQASASSPGDVKLLNDPLSKWLSPASCVMLRSIENQINRTLVANEKYVSLAENEAISKLSPMAAFFYVCLFRSVRKLLSSFIPSNPTWVKVPKSKAERKRPSHESIFEVFLDQVRDLTLRNSERAIDIPPPTSGIALQIGNAEQLTLRDNTVDVVVSSPPYCTRIDYAVATALELAVLRFQDDRFGTLRRSLTGTSTVEKNVEEPDTAWGSTCLRFLEELYEHPSRASQGYYYKNHVQYFRSINNSIKEISRVLKRGGLCFLVAQDSHYKELHNDVPSIISEMAEHSGMNLIRRDNFLASRSMAKVNQKAKRYLMDRNSIESVLCLRHH